jgi:hypothetical protein
MEEFYNEGLAARKTINSTSAIRSHTHYGPCSAHALNTLIQECQEQITHAQMAIIKETTGLMKHSTTYPSTCARPQETQVLGHWWDFNIHIKEEKEYKQPPTLQHIIDQACQPHSHTYSFRCNSCRVADHDSNCECNQCNHTQTCTGDEWIQLPPTLIINLNTRKDHTRRDKTLTPILNILEPYHAHDSGQTWQTSVLTAHSGTHGKGHYTCWAQRNGLVDRRTHFIHFNDVHITERALQLTQGETFSTLILEQRPHSNHTQHASAQSNDTVDHRTNHKKRRR